MRIKDYKCKCGHNDFFFMDKGNQKGIYCSYCGKWLKWADKDEQNLALRQESAECQKDSSEVTSDWPFKVQVGIRMTEEERKLALYCLKAYSDKHSEVCEECVKYPNCDHTIQDDVIETVIKALEQESCDDAVSRQAVLEIFGYVMSYWKEHAIDVEPHEIKDALIEQYEFTAKQLSELPPVTPQSKMGHWIRNDKQGVQAVGYLTYHCSECGREISSKYHGKISIISEYPYCHCGAKMEVESEGIQ